jgi:predicted amidohydrolase
MNRLSLASIQPPFYEEKSLELNARTIEAGFGLLEEALQKGVAFCCLPEFFNVFGAAQHDMPEASRNHHELLDRAARLARRHESFIVLPLLVDDGGTFFDRAYLIGDRGEVVGHYDKIHPTLGEREQLHIDPGDELGLFETRYGRVAVAICYDVYFPELFAALTLSRPEIIFLPSLQRSEHEVASEAIVKVRAMDAKAYLVRSSFGREATRPWRAGMMFGQSCVVHPDGTVLANAGHHEGFALAHVTVPFDWQRPRCGGYPSMSVREFLEEDRRPETYRA